jgi:acyl-CoA thioesterase-2
MRHVGSPIYFNVEGEKVAHQAVWLKALAPLPDDAALHTAALAYVSDYTILESIYRRHGISWAHPGLSSASLDHAMWFHRPAKVDEWMLYVQESPSAQSGRGLALGRIYSRDGILLATVAQEGMVRVPEIGRDSH